MSQLAEAIQTVRSRRYVAGLGQWLIRGPMKEQMRQNVAVVEDQKQSGQLWLRDYMVSSSDQSDARPANPHMLPQAALPRKRHYCIRSALMHAICATERLPFL